MVPDIRPDDLSHPSVLALLDLHLQEMHASSPPGTVFALDLSGLKAPGVSVWAEWRDGQAVGIGALRRLSATHGEIKSMRTHPDHLRTGVAARLLRHILGEARRENLRRISLETGSGPAFEPALALYRRHGFVHGEAFGDYPECSLSQYLHLDLAAE